MPHGHSFFGCTNKKRLPRLDDLGGHPFAKRERFDVINVSAFACIVFVMEWIRLVCVSAA